jgi:hypothetical protein
VTLQIQKKRGTPGDAGAAGCALRCGQRTRRLAHFRAPTKVVWQPVKVLSVGEEAAQVTGDLKPGEKIVALGAHLLHEGESVRLAEPRCCPCGSKP